MIAKTLEAFDEAPRGVFRLPSVRRTEGGAPGARRGVGGVDHGGPQAAMAFARLARRPLAGAFIMARGDPGPRRQVVRTGKARHLGAHRGDDHVGGVAGHPRDGVQQAHRFVKRAADGWDPRINAGDGLIEAVNLAEPLRPEIPI
jgi:hypothetical protein